MRIIGAYDALPPLDGAAGHRDDLAVAKAYTSKHLLSNTESAFEVLFSMRNLTKTDAVAAFNHTDTAWAADLSYFTFRDSDLYIALFAAAPARLISEASALLSSELLPRRRAVPCHV